MAKFEKLRVSLAREDDSPLLAEVDQNEPLSRTEFLRRAFSESRQFLNSRKTRFNFFPIDPEETPDGFAAGFFARERPVPLNHADLTPYMAENYEPALFLLSLDKAQVIWMESKSNVGSPKSILESFFDNLLKKSTLSDWRAFVSYFETEQDYWRVIQEHRSEITKLTFRYVPPNAFEGRKLAQRYHTEVQQEVGSEVHEESFKSEPGKMNPESEMMRANAEIAEQGAGEREVRGRGNKLLYASGHGRQTEDVADDDLPTVQSPSFVRRVINRLFDR